MPTRAPSVCGLCSGIHASGVRCEKAKAADGARKARHDRKRPSARLRGYDKQWQREAKAFLALPQNKRCARCPAPATVVMHIKSIRTRPDLRMDRTNWRPGCQRCNAIEAAQERRALKGA